MKLLFPNIHKLDKGLKIQVEIIKNPPNDVKNSDVKSKYFAGILSAMYPPGK